MKDLVANNEGGFVDSTTNLYNCVKLQFVRTKITEFEAYKKFSSVLASQVCGENSEALNIILRSLVTEGEEKLWDFV